MLKNGRRTGTRKKEINQRRVRKETEREREREREKMEWKWRRKSGWLNQEEEETENDRPSRVPLHSVASPSETNKKTRESKKKTNLMEISRLLYSCRTRSRVSPTRCLVNFDSLFHWALLDSTDFHPVLQSVRGVIPDLTRFRQV